MYPIAQRNTLQNGKLVFPSGAVRISYPRGKTMPQSTHDRAAELHGLAEHTHAAAVVSHDKADHLTSHELSKVADERSTTKGKHDDEVAAEVAEPDKA
jgi:hypothetical protein